MRASSVICCAVAAFAAVASSNDALAAPGDLDPSFGAAGEVVSPLASLSGMALDPLGRVLASGFLQNDPVWRNLEQLPPGELTSPFYLRLEVEDRAGVLARIAHELATESVSVAQLVQQPRDGHAVLHVVTHEAAAGHVRAALAAIGALAEARGEATAMPVISGRGVAELGWA